MALDATGLNRPNELHNDLEADRTPTMNPLGGEVDSLTPPSPNRLDEGAFTKQQFLSGRGASRASQALGPDGPGMEIAYAPTDVKKQVTVGSNDTLKSLAEKNGVSEREIIRANPGKEAPLEDAMNHPETFDINRTMVGQKLNIPNPEPASDRAVNMLKLNFRSTGGREVIQMEETAANIQKPELNGTAGPGAGWTPQQRLNFARARVDMQHEGTSLKQIVGEKAVPEVASHLAGDLLAGSVEAEAAAGPLGLAIGAGGELMTGSMAKIVSDHGDYQMARDVERLHQQVIAQGNESPLDLANMDKDGGYTGSLISGGGDPKPYQTALVLLYKATFSN